MVRFLCLSGSFEECMNERRVHQIFEISVLLKGAHALIECIGGLVLTFVSTSVIKKLVNALTQEEVIEDPGYCAQFYPNANCQNLGPGNPSTDGGYFRDHNGRAMQTAKPNEHRYHGRPNSND